LEELMGAEGTGSDGVSTKFQFPILLLEKDSGDVRRYDSLHELMVHLEAVDVEAGEYEAWDKIGIPLSLSVVQEKDWLSLVAAGAPRPQKARSAILGFATRQQLPTLPEIPDDLLAAIDLVAAEVRKKWMAKSWWERFKSRF
jgi:hypothetical protein